MEVYQSSRSAEELEYALGAVPRIGENGNWFIGDQDTGIFAGGVDVTGAEVGQTIKVTEVDENGRPTAWEPSDFPAFMPFANVKSNLIVSGSVAKDENDAYPTMIEITQRDDGTPLNLRAFVIQTDVKSGYSYTLAMFNGTNWLTNGAPLSHNDIKCFNTYILGADGELYVSGCNNARGFLAYGGGNFQSSLSPRKFDTIQAIRFPSIGGISGGTYYKIWELCTEG